MPSINDNIADALEVVIETNGGTYTSPSLDTNENTTEVGEVEISASSNVSAWWYYDPASSANATFDTSLSTPTTTGTDTYLAIWTGTDFSDMVLVASDDDSGGSGTSRIPDLPVSAGTRYWAQVGGFGNQTMNLVFRVTGPASESGGGGPINGDVIAVPATATATVHAPVVSGTTPGDANVVAVPATAVAQAHEPTIEGTTVVEGGGPAAATATAHAPVVSGTNNVNVQAVAATATATAHPPAVSGTSGGTGGQGFLNAWYSDGVTWTQV
jgi:hypothetical protein